MLGPGGRSTKQREQQTHRRGGISPLRKRRAPRTEERERVFFNSRFHELNLGENPVLNFNSGLPELNLDENPVLYGDRDNKHTNVVFCFLACPHKDPLHGVYQRKHQKAVSIPSIE